MYNYEPLIHGNYYHIFNRGIDGTDLFKTNSNYETFLNKYDDYIKPIANTYAWSLLGNHFHLLVRIHDEEQITFIKPKEDDKRTFAEKKKYDPTRQFSHFFNAYAKYFNKRNNRHGGLFTTPFERIKINNKQYFKELVFYIHNNPVKHGFIEKMNDYPWSSFNTVISIKPTKLQRNMVIGWFNSVSEFKEFHKRDPNSMNFDPFDIE